MDLTSPGRGMSMYAPVVEEPGIVLQWLVRLRWLALAGQLAATAVAVEFLQGPACRFRGWRRSLP